MNQPRLPMGMKTPILVMDKPWSKGTHQAATLVSIEMIIRLVIRLDVLAETSRPSGSRRTPSCL
jgi:hypothetical protein